MKAGLCAAVLAAATGLLGWGAARAAVARIERNPDPVPRELLAAELPGEEVIVHRSDGTRLSATSAGSGRPVVLAHGYTAGSWEWNLVHRELIGRGYRVIAFDQRGHGRSTIGSEGVGSGPMAADYAALLEHFDVRDGVLVGLQSVLKGLTKLPADVIGMGSDVLDLGAQTLNLKPRMASAPFTARPTLFNNTAKSAARAYADTQLPLAKVEAVAKATDTSVNDVVMTVIDDALHHYLREHQAPTDRPLVALMPMSLRDELGRRRGQPGERRFDCHGCPRGKPR
jgi:hypothetical protein